MDWKAAETIVGQASGDDFRLNPLEHAERYEKQAPALADILRAGAVQSTVKAYDLADSEAIEAQALYKRWMGRINFAVFVTSILGAATMAAAIMLPAGSISESWIGRTFAGLSALSAAFGVFSLYRLREGHLLVGWMTARASAETQRLGYFSALASAAANKGQPDLLVLVLEYARRYQLEMEKTYYWLRGAQHRASANQTVAIGAIGAAIAVISGGMSAAGPWPWLGALSVTGAAIGAYATAREQTNQDRRNEERYRRSWDALNGLSGRLDEVRAAANAGNGSAVVEFIAAVNDQISLEHRQWLDASESNKAALGRLEEALEKKAGFIGTKGEEPMKPASA